MTAKYGLPYFQNFVNADLDPHDPLDVLPPAARSHRAAEARQRPLRFGAEQTGSIGAAVTINCARIGFVHSADDAALARLDELLEIARDSLVAKRATIARHLDGGLFP